MSECCEYLKTALADRAIPIRYQPIFREYYFEVFEYSDILGEYYLPNTVMQLIDFCPFCGAEVPKPLRDNWCKILRKIGHADPFDDPTIPEEFNSDAWWKSGKYI